MSRSAVVFTTVSQFVSHHEDGIEIILHQVHILKLVCLSIVSDRLDILKSRELSVLLAQSVD